MIAYSFKCTQCHRVFREELNERSLFVELAAEDRVPVCDDCVKKMAS